MKKQEVSEILEHIGMLLELKGENPFKTRAYHNGARIISSLQTDLDDAVKTEQLRKIKGIGKALFEKIRELVTTGSLIYYEELKASVPPGLFEILRIPGLGPKRARVLYDQLGVKTVGELEYACNENRLLDLEGFGARMQDRILEGIRYIKRYRGRFLFSTGYTEAQEIYDFLKGLPAVQRVEIAGSLRRKKETVKDIDFVASSEARESVMEAFVSIPSVHEVIAKGPTKTSVRLRSGIQADLRVVSDAAPLPAKCRKPRLNSVR